MPQVVEAREEAEIRVRARARAVSGWRCSDRTRAIFEACTSGGRTTAEVAREFGVSPGFVRIIRHRGKIEATISNARATFGMRGWDGPGSTLADLVWSHRPARTPVPGSAAEVPTTSPESIALAKELKRRGFRFVGPTTMFALMEALGVVDTHLLGSHRRGTSGLWAADGAPIVQSHTPS